MLAFPQKLFYFYFYFFNRGGLGSARACFAVAIMYKWKVDLSLGWDNNLDLQDLVVLLRGGLFPRFILGLCTDNKRRLEFRHLSAVYDDHDNIHLSAKPQPSAQPGRYHF